MVCSCLRSFCIGVSLCLPQAPPRQIHRRRPAGSIVFGCDRRLSVTLFFCRSVLLFVGRIFPKLQQCWKDFGTDCSTCSSTMWCKLVVKWEPAEAYASFKTNSNLTLESEVYWYITHVCQQIVGRWRRDQTIQPTPRLVSTMRNWHSTDRQLDGFDG